MTPGVGADIEAMCSKCGDVWHVIVAKVGDDVVKVHCKECQAEHRYRTPPGKGEVKAKKVVKKRAPVARIDKPTVDANLAVHPRKYSASEKFAIGERVEHPIFGQGVVEETPDPGKFTAFFATGRKVLVHDKGAGAQSLSRPKPFDHANPPAGGKPVGNA